MAEATATAPDVTWAYHRPCLRCGLALETVEGTTAPHICEPPASIAEAIARAYWAGHDRAQQ